MHMIDHAVDVHDAHRHMSWRLLFTAVSYDKGRVQVRQARNWFATDEITPGIFKPN